MSKIPNVGALASREMSDYTWRGTKFFPSESRLKAIYKIAACSGNRATFSSWQKLSQREREVLKLIAEGYKNKEIAEDLCNHCHT